MSVAADAGGPVTGPRVVRHVRTSSAAKIAFALSLTLSAILLVGLVALYVLGSASGALGTVEEFVQNVGFPEFEIRFFGFIPAFVFFAIIGSAAVAAIAAGVAALYNVLSDLVGGIEIDSRES